MSTLAWIACLAWVAVAVAGGAVGAARGLREGRGGHAAVRLRSPTLYLFAAYLVVAALVVPRAPGESSSALLGLAPAIVVAYVVATGAAVGRARRSRLSAFGVAALHGGAVLAAGAVLLARCSPEFVPAWLR